MVLDEADGARGPHPQEPWRPALAVYEPPVLPSAHGLLQYACTPKEHFAAMAAGQLKPMQPDSACICLLSCKLRFVSQTA